VVSKGGRRLVSVGGMVKSGIAVMPSDRGRMGLGGGAVVWV
jgi:hypothetical protein